MRNKEPVTFELQEQPKKKKQKRKKSIKERLPIIIPLLVVLIIAAGTVAFLVLNASETGSTGIVAGERAPISAAVVTEVGFTDNAGKDNATPEAVTEGHVGDTIYSYCKVEDYDIGTSVAITWTAPDGSILRTSSLSVNRDGYYYSQIDVDQEGTYTVSWQIYTKDAVSNTVEITAAEAGDNESTETETPDIGTDDSDATDTVASEADGAVSEN